MGNDGEVCLICDEVPCACKPVKKVRRASTTSKRAPTSTPSQPAPVARKIPKRSIMRASSMEAKTEDSAAVEPPDENWGMVSDEDTEDLEMVRAVRLLAHLIHPDDENLKRFGDAILPSDRLPPEERIPDWKRRVGGS